MATVTPTVTDSAAQAIKRRSSVASLVIDRTLADCDVLDFRHAAAAAIKPPASVTAIAFYGCDSAGGTFTAIHDSDGTAVTITVTALDWYDFPAACFAFPYIKIVSTTADGTAAIVVKT